MRELLQSELKAADITALEEEYNALMSDKAGEAEYLQSLEKQVEKLKVNMINLLVIYTKQ